MDRKVVEVSSLSLSFCDYLPTYLSFSLFHLITYLSIYLSLSFSLSSVYLSSCLPVHLSIYLSICLSVYLSVCLAASLKLQLFCETSSVFELDNVKNRAILRDLLMFWSRQHQKRSNSTSFKHGNLSAELTASCQCVLRFFDSTCLNYCACHEKVIPGHTKCCTCHAKSSQQTWRSDAPKCNPSQGISARTSWHLW